MPSAARITATATIKSNHIPDLIASMTAKAHQAVVDQAHEVQDLAKQLAAVDTGSMQASIYVNDGQDSDYVEAVASAEARNRGVVILGEISPEFVISLDSGGNPADMAVVGVAAGHGIFNEFGTVHMRPQPFMTPAALTSENDFTEKMNHVADL